MAATLTLIRSASELRALVAGAAAPGGCRCGLGACTGWDSVTDDRWPAAQLQQLGTLRDPAIDEPTFEERHPDGTRYDSPGAPVAVGFFPYNRCDLWRCGPCGRHLLRYTEFGGYYIDHRVRVLDPARILD
jgi:hypothetical protein